MLGFSKIVELLATMYTLQKNKIFLGLCHQKLHVEPLLVNLGEGETSKIKPNYPNERYKKDLVYTSWVGVTKTQPCSQALG